MSVEIKLGYDHKDEVLQLFSEYIEMLNERNPTIGQYLTLQNYDDERLHLERKYGLPDGRLFIAYVDGKAAGCVALRKLDEGKGELKRMYVRPEFRNNHLGRALTNKVIEEARKIGYSYVYLDTLPELTEAISMYKSIGFYEIENYNDSPENTLFFRFDC